MELIHGALEAPWCSSHPAFGLASPRGGHPWGAPGLWHRSAGGTADVCTCSRGNNSNTYCRKWSCLLVAETCIYIFLEGKIMKLSRANNRGTPPRCLAAGLVSPTLLKTAPHTQLLGRRVQQLFTLWTLSDVQSSTECFMPCSTNHKSG